MAFCLVILTLCFVGVPAALADSKRNLTVVMILNDPFLMLKDFDYQYNSSFGNNDFEGYGVDLMLELGKVIGHNLEIKLVDGYGVYNENTGQWNGMVGELIEEKADMVIADLTMTESREKVIDFSVPFMKVGIQMLLKKPKETKEDPFSFLYIFLYIFSSDVWISLIASYLGMAFLYFIPRLINMKKSQEKKTAWFGLHLLKVTGIIFTIFVICIYSANMAPFLTYTRTRRSIESVEDLAKQNKIKFGWVKSGSTEAYFRNSDSYPFDLLWEKMSENPSMLSSSVQTGVDRVKKENGYYAFFMESITAEYVVERVCDLEVVGGPLNQNYFGIGLPLKSEYRKPINKAILQMKSNGILAKLKQKWWLAQRGGGSCAGTAPEGVMAQIGLCCIGGIFWLLLVCLICVVVVLASEWVWQFCTQNVLVNVA